MQFVITVFYSSFENAVHNYDEHTLFPEHFLMHARRFIKGTANLKVGYTLAWNTFIAAVEMHVEQCSESSALSYKTFEMRRNLKLGVPFFRSLLSRNFNVMDML